jgi:5-methylcytosine-specific restriction endonuclease McrA
MGMSNSTGYEGGQPHGNHTIVSNSMELSPRQVTQWVKELIKQGNMKPFYNSAIWEHTKREVLEAQHHECQVCKRKGMYAPAEAVHHIKFLKSCPELALTKSNLVCLCKECHYAIHHRVENKPQLNKERW